MDGWADLILTLPSPSGHGVVQSTIAEFCLPSMKKAGGLSSTGFLHSVKIPFIALRPPGFR